MEDKVKKFKSIFYGMDRAYGQYKSNGESKNGKAGGAAFIIKKPVVDKLWEDHLAGKDPSLGIIPIRDDSTCIWGCIDVDTYPLKHKELIAKIRNLGLPLVMCRSKSGGAHVFLFTKEPVEALYMRDKLMEWAGELGYADCEIFPKQIEIKPERGDTGNFLNLPYHDGDNSLRYCFNDDGASVDLSGFFDLYDKYCTTKEDLENLVINRKHDVKDMDDGPPCLATLMSQGVPQGGRDNTLYQYAVYAKKKWPEEWQDKMDSFNYKYMDPPVSSQQVQKTIRQHEKKDYKYKCKDQPMCSVCSPLACRIRQHGIGNDALDLVSDLTKYESDESTWELNINGKKIKLTTDQLEEQSKFRRECVNQANEYPVKLRPNDWDNRLRALLKTAQIFIMPHEVTRAGRFEILLERFLEDQGEADHIDEIEIGKALFEEKAYFEKINDESNRATEVEVKRMTAFFKSEELQKFLKKNDFKNFTPTEILAHIRGKLKGGDARRRVKGKPAFILYVPWQRKNQDTLKVPDMGEETPF